MNCVFFLPLLWFRYFYIHLHEHIAKSTDSLCLEHSPFTTNSHESAKRFLLLLLLFFFNVASTARSLATTAPLHMCVVVYVFEIFCILIFRSRVYVWFRISVFGFLWRGIRAVCGLLLLQWMVIAMSAGGWCSFFDFTFMCQLGMTGS